MFDLIMTCSVAALALTVARHIWQQITEGRRQHPRATPAEVQRDHKEDRRLRKKAEHDEWWAAYMSLLPKAPEPPSPRRWSYQHECTCDVVDDSTMMSRSPDYIVTRVDQDCRYHGRASRYAEDMVKYEAAKRIHRRDTMYSLQQHPYRYPRKAPALPTTTELNRGVLMSGEYLHRV